MPALPATLRRQHLRLTVAEPQFASHPRQRSMRNLEKICGSIQFARLTSSAFSRSNRDSGRRGSRKAGVARGIRGSRSLVALSRAHERESTSRVSHTF